VTSNWHKLEDAIKVAISAWPIVFAAVVAQCFKAYATFKVERGIKLMELEQLVGSSSFASAMKQPILLRRLDLLTVALFAIWCLSPIGSQALVRVYSKERDFLSDNTTVKLVPNHGYNKLFSSNDSFRTITDNPEYAEVSQLVQSYFISALSPEPVMKQYVTDQYLHPIMFHPDGWTPVQAFGSFLTYPESKLFEDGSSDYSSNSDPSADPNPKYEMLSFNMSNSHFNFTCKPWQNKTRQQLDTMQNETDNYVYFSWSDSYTFGVAFTPNLPNETESASTANDITGIRVASANNVHSDKTRNATEQSWDEDPSYEYSYIECGFEQVFEEVEVFCYTDEGTTSSLPSCSAGTSRPAPEDQREKMATKFGDFSELFVAGNPGGIHVMIDSPVTLSKQTPPTLCPLKLPQGSSNMARFDRRDLSCDGRRTYGRHAERTRPDLIRQHHLGGVRPPLRVPVQHLPGTRLLPGMRQHVPDVRARQPDKRGAPVHGYPGRGVLRQGPHVRR